MSHYFTSSCILQCRDHFRELLLPHWENKVAEVRHLYVTLDSSICLKDRTVSIHSNFWYVVLLILMISSIIFFAGVLSKVSQVASSIGKPIAPTHGLMGVVVYVGIVSSKRLA